MSPSVYLGKSSFCLASFRYVIQLSSPLEMLLTIWSVHNWWRLGFGSWNDKNVIAISTQVKGHATYSQTTKNIFALIYVAVTCIYHNEIWHVYNLNCQLLPIIKIVAPNITTFAQLNCSYPISHMRDTPVTMAGSLFHVGGGGGGDRLCPVRVVRMFVSQVKGHGFSILMWMPLCL